MLYHFPPGSLAIACEDYQRAYADPISIREGAEVVPDYDRTALTDFIGWTWCKAADGREGWVPNGWTTKSNAILQLKRDYSARELTVSRGDRVELLYSESGFVYCRAPSGESGWLPDGVLELIASG